MELAVLVICVIWTTFIVIIHEHIYWFTPQIDCNAQWRSLLAWSFTSHSKSFFFLETALLPVKGFLVRFSPFMHLVGNVFKNNTDIHIFFVILSIYSYFFHDQFFFLTSEKNGWVQDLSTSSTYIDDALSLTLSLSMWKNYVINMCDEEVLIH